MAPHVCNIIASKRITVSKCMVCGKLHETESLERGMPDQETDVRSLDSQKTWKVKPPHENCRLNFDKN